MVPQALTYMSGRCFAPMSGTPNARRLKAVTWINIHLEVRRVEAAVPEVLLICCLPRCPSWLSYGCRCVDSLSPVELDTPSQR